MTSNAAEYIKHNIQQAVTLKQQVLDDSDLLDKLEQVCQLCVTALNNNRKIIFAGNGGSAADAQHLAAELVGRYKYDRPGLASIALTTDTSILTAVGNDYGYQQVFSRQLEANGQSGDVFIGISTSGNSANILAALKTAKAKDIITVGFAGDGGAIQQQCDYCLNIPSNNTARIQECHIMIGQIICGYVEMTIFPQNKP